MGGRAGADRNGNPGTNIYFPHTGDPLTGVIGSYSIGHDWTVFDGMTYEVFVGVKASASNGAHLYLDDPLTFLLPAGVTFTASSGSNYAAVSSVPEPETNALMLAGLAVIAFIARRRKRMRAGV